MMTTQTKVQSVNGEGVIEVGTEATVTPSREVVQHRPLEKGWNIHQRKRAVMARVGAISHDKTHPHHGFTYNSIDNISAALRGLFLEYGIDYCPSCTSDGATMVVELVNIDKPDDKIVSSWPVIEDDKGFAYSTKFPLVRMFLIADGGKDDPNKAGENDEAHMASQKPVQPRTASPQPSRAPAPTGNRPLGECSECVDLGVTAASGKPSAYWPSRKEGKPPQCNGCVKGADGNWVYLNHVKPEDPRQLSGVGAAVRTAADNAVPLEAYSDDIPF